MSKGDNFKAFGGEESVFSAENVAHFACAHAIDEYGGLSPEVLKQRSLSERFSAIHNIKVSIHLRYPILRDGAPQAIDLDEINDEIATLTGLSESIRLNTEYETMVLTVTRKAVEALTTDIRDVSRLRQWATLDEETREMFLVRLHNATMLQTRQFFGEDTELGKAFENAMLKSFKEEGLRLDPRTKLVTGGFVSDKAEYNLNYHPDAKIHDVFKAFNVVAHETAHIIEKVARDFCSHAAGVEMPQWLAEVAEILKIRSDCKATIPSILGAPYKLQCNEVVAFAAGNKAEKTLGRELMRPRLVSAPPTPNRS